jgi:hypothetical protein
LTKATPLRLPAPNLISPSNFESFRDRTRVRRATAAGLSPGLALFRAIFADKFTEAFSLPEVIHIAFGLAPTYTRAEYRRALNKYRIEEFAVKGFRQHWKAELLSRKPVTIEDIVCFQVTPLKRPLLHSVPRNLKCAGATLFSLILEYSLAIPCSNQGNCLKTILQMLRSNTRELTDEIYFQLLKQTTDNVREDVLQLTWQLF